MKVMGFVVIIVGLIMVYVGITGSQHNLMATLKGSTSLVKSGQNVNTAGSGGNNTQPGSNPFPATPV